MLGTGLLSSKVWNLSYYVNNPSLFIFSSCALSRFLFSYQSSCYGVCSTCHAFVLLSVLWLLLVLPCWNSPENIPVKFAAAHIFMTWLGKKKQNKIRYPGLIQFVPRHVVSMWFLTFNVDFCRFFVKERQTIWVCGTLWHVWHSYFPSCLNQPLPNTYMYQCFHIVQTMLALVCLLLYVITLKSSLDILVLFTT